MTFAFRSALVRDKCQRVTTGVLLCVMGTVSASAILEPALRGESVVQTQKLLKSLPNRVRELSAATVQTTGTDVVSVSGTFVAALGKPVGKSTLFIRVDQYGSVGAARGGLARAADSMSEAQGQYDKIESVRGAVYSEWNKWGPLTVMGQVEECVLIVQAPTPFAATIVKKVIEVLTEELTTRSVALRIEIQPLVWEELSRLGRSR